MSEHDDVPSVDNDALASTAQPDNADVEGGAGARAAPSQHTGRLQQLIRDKQAADALAATSAAQAAALRERLQSPQRPQDYRAAEDYTRAVAEQAVREVGAEILARQACQAQEAAARAAQEAWAEATAAFREKAPDFDAVAHNPDLAITPVMANVIRESSRGAEIAYYLGKNPAEAARIAQLSPVSQAAAIARLEARIEDPQTSISKAPPPVGALSGRSGSGGKRLEDMSFEEYRRARGY
ncbi:MAG: hypothetical protein WAN43_14155 [Rhodomicrobium sp.]|jgi:hypothetical protein